MTTAELAATYAASIGLCGIEIVLNDKAASLMRVLQSDCVELKCLEASGRPAHPTRFNRTVWN